MKYIIQICTCLFLLSSKLWAVVIVEGTNVAGHNAIAGQASHDPIGLLETDTCTGTLISPTQVLTAAHCTANTTFTIDGQLSVTITSFSIHPSYTGSGPNDLAILTLATPIFSVTPAVLASNLATGMNMHSSGYGDQSQAGIPNGTTAGIPGANARTGYTNVLDVYNSAQNIYTYDLDVPGVNTLGNGYIDGSLEGSGAFGDSGSPVFVDAPDGNTYITGVVVGGQGNPNEAGDHTFVSTWQDQDTIDWLTTNGVTLNDWTVIPEPSSTLLLFSALFCLSTGRRKG